MIMRRFFNPCYADLLTESLFEGSLCIASGSKCERVQLSLVLLARLERNSTKQSELGLLLLAYLVRHFFNLCDSVRADQSIHYLPSKLKNDIVSIHEWIITFGRNFPNFIHQFPLSLTF